MTKVDVVDIKNASREEFKAFMLASKEFENEINDPDFWYEVSKVYNKWKYSNGLSFKEFKALVLSGQDKFESMEDFIIRISVEFYYSFRSVVGYTLPNTWMTWANRNIFKNFDIADIAGNQFHEYLHNCGFDHPGADKQSLTYQAGYLLRDRIKRRLGLKKNIRKRSFFGRIGSFFKRIF